MNRSPLYAFPASAFRSACAAVPELHRRLTTEFRTVGFAMVLSTVFEPPDLLVATVRDTVTGSDQVRLVEWIREAIRSRGAVRVLLKLDRFGGWLPGVGAMDAAAMWLRDDERVQRMAIVGEAPWRREVLTIVAQPVRGIPIEYFEAEAAARAWLNVPGTKSPLQKREAS